MVPTFCLATNLQLLLYSVFFYTNWIMCSCQTKMVNIVNIAPPKYQHVVLFIVSVRMFLSTLTQSNKYRLSKLLLTFSSVIKLSCYSVTNRSNTTWVTLCKAVVPGFTCEKGSNLAQNSSCLHSQQFATFLTPLRTHPSTWKWTVKYPSASCHQAKYSLERSF